MKTKKKIPQKKVRKRKVPRTRKKRVLKKPGKRGFLKRLFDRFFKKTVKGAPSSEVRGGRILTRVDFLEKLVEKEGRITSSRAAEILSTQRKNVEEWAFALKDAGRIELSYSFAGNLVLSKVKKE